ncbi:hypothetical protein D9M72_191990 [compost metagenome]
MGDLQRQAVARIVDHDVTVQLDRAREVAVQPGACRRDMPALALVGAGGQRFACLNALPEHRLHGAVGSRDHHPRAQGMAHHEARIVGQGMVDHRERVAVVAMQQFQGGFEALQRVGVGARDRNTARVSLCHDAILPV